LDDKEEALALLRFGIVRVEFAINEFLVIINIINPILLVTLLKYEIIHEK
jgi:hypothetical protein